MNPSADRAWLRTNATRNSNYQPSGQSNWPVFNQPTRSMRNDNESKLLKVQPLRPCDPCRPVDLHAQEPIRWRFRLCGSAASGRGEPNPPSRDQRRGTRRALRWNVLWRTRCPTGTFPSIANAVHRGAAFGYDSMGPATLWAVLSAGNSLV